VCVFERGGGRRGRKRERQESERARERGGGREKEMQVKYCLRVAACCSSNPRRTWGVGFLRHLSCVSRTIDRAHKAHSSCVYPVLISFCDVRAWGGGREKDRVKQRTNVKEREREI